MTHRELIPSRGDSSGETTDSSHDRIRDLSQEIRGEDECGSPAELLNTLADADSRAILTVTRKRPFSVSEIVDTCNIPTATAYRKVNTLVDVGLLDEHIRIRPYGRNVCKYSLRVDSVHAVLTENDESVVRISVTTRPPRQEYSHPLTDGGEVDGAPETPPEQQRLRSLFVEVTGTDELVEEQERDSPTRHVEAADGVAVSEYVTTVAKDDGLTDTLPEPDTGSSE